MQILEQLGLRLGLASLAGLNLYLTNIALSITENIVVAAGTLLMPLKPVVALCFFTAALIVLWLVLPRMFRVIRRSFEIIRDKLGTLFGRGTEDYSVAAPGSSRA